MTFLAWIVLLLIAAAVAAATVMRTRPAARISEAQRLRVPPVPRDDLAGLGLSAPRPATPRADGPRPVTEPTARPIGSPVAATRGGATPSAWIGDVLDAPDDPPRRADAEADPLETLDAEPLDAARLDLAELGAPAGPLLDLSPEDVEDTLVEDEAGAAPAYSPEPDEAPDDSTVWTFDHDAAATAAPATAPTARPAYVRDGQALWPKGDAAAALLAASLAAHLGGTVAVLRQDGADYLVELLAGDAAERVPADAALEALAAEGHPLHRVPQDGVLSLLGHGAALPYHDAPRQTLVQTLAEAPHARVLLVADVPPGAPDIDGATAALVSGYADLLAGLTRAPLAPDSETASTPDLPDVPDEAVLDEDDVPGDAMPDADTPNAGIPDDAGAAEPEENATEALTPDATEAPPADGTVARPGTRRAAPRTSRGIILTGEIDAARRDRRLLVFALVTLADAETVVRAGDAGVVRAEAALRQRLTAARAVRRVEPFGSLLFGVFLDAEGPEVVQWAERLSAQGHPLLVGAVPATGSEESVRAAATEALQSAYEREVVCVVAA